MVRVMRWAQAATTKKDEKKRRIKKAQASTKGARGTRRIISVGAVKSVRNKHSCAQCEASLVNIIPFDLDGLLYCSNECVRWVTAADDASVARRADVTAVAWGMETMAVSPVAALSNIFYIAQATLICSMQY
jgi:hypothetical protein